MAGTVALTAIVFVNLSQRWGFPDTHFPLEKGEKIKLDEPGATQTFLASRDGLSGVNVLFGGSNIKNGGTLSLSILDENCMTTLREEKRFITELNADNSTDFRFSRIPDSAEKVFCFKTSFLPEKGSKKAYIFSIQNTLPDEKRSLSINGENRPHESLALRPVYRSGSILPDLAELDQRISQYKPWFLKGSLLATVVFLSIGLSFAFLILIVFFREENATPDNTRDTNRRNS